MELTFAVDVDWMLYSVYSFPKENAGDKPGAEHRNKGPQNFNAVESAEEATAFSVTSCRLTQVLCTALPPVDSLRFCAQLSKDTQ